MSDLVVGGRATRMPAGERGALDIADRVIAKLAGRAAGEIDGVEVQSAGGLRHVVHSDALKVQAEGDPHSTTVSVVVGVAYPLPVFKVAAQIRRQVANRLAELAGVEQAEVRVEVAEMTMADLPARRVL